MVTRKTRPTLSLNHAPNIVPLKALASSGNTNGIWQGHTSIPVTKSNFLPSDYIVVSSLVPTLAAVTAAVDAPVLVGEHQQPILIGTQG